MLRGRQPINSQCSYCGEWFSKTGLKLHRGSQKCDRKTAARPLIEATKAEKERLLAAGKVTIPTSAALAIKRRDTVGFCGLEKSESKMITNNGYGPFEVISEYWVYSWLYSKWWKFKSKGKSNIFYRWLEKVCRMDEEGQERAKGFALLETLDV